MKRILLLLAAAIPCMSSAQETRDPELYTPAQIMEKFGVEVADGNYAPVVGAILQWMNEAAGDDAWSADLVAESLKEMAQRLPEPARGMVNFIVADLYNGYWQNNRWQIRDRTSAPDAGGTLDTWDLKRLFSEAVKYYSLALADPAVLKATPTEKYDQILAYNFSRRLILDNESDTAHFASLYPTLYDVVLSMTIQAFSGWMGNVMPSQGLSLDDARYFAPAREFVDVPIAEQEEPSAEYEVLTMYQHLLRFRLAELDRGGDEADVIPLVLAEVGRLKYLRGKNLNEDKYALYEAALRRLADEYANYLCSAWPLLELADFCMEQGSKWSTGSGQQFRGKYAEAYNVCDSVAVKWPRYSEYARSLQREITAQTLQLTTEKRPSPGEPFLALAEHRNVEKLYIRAYRLDGDSEVRTQNADKQDWTWLGDRAPVLEMSPIELPDYGDYQRHTSQFAISALPQGDYLLIAADVPWPSDWQSNKNLLVTETYIQVSSLACITSDADGELYGLHDRSAIKQIYVTEAKTGKPVAGARVDAYMADFDSARDSAGNYPEKLAGTYRTNGGGVACISDLAPDKSRIRRLSRIEITTTDGGRLTEDYYMYFRGSDYEEPDDDPTAFFFTDRAIYRPGQTVYYKVLLIGPDGRGGNIPLAGEEIEIELYDVNYKEVAVQEVVTNEFGSAQGSFTIPQGLLNGWMTLEADWGGEISIRVEEYKRPTFEIEFDPVDEIYRYDDKVEITGTAKALAGYSVDNSTVKYRVTRQGGYDPLYRSRNYRPMSTPLEIAEGEVTTSADGKFAIRFDASAESIRYRDVVSNFTISVDITDLNGETRSATTSVAVSDNPLRILAYLPGEVNDRKKLQFDLETTNHNGRRVAGNVNVTVEALEGPGRILRDRLWAKADTTLIGRGEFERLFPNDIYSNEDDPSTYSVRERVGAFTIATTAAADDDKSDADTLDLGLLARSPAGWYRVTLKAADNSGATAKNVYTLRLNGTPSGRQTPIVNVDQWVVAETESRLEPGDEAVFLVAAPERGTTVRYEIYRPGRKAESRTMKAGPVPQKVTLPIREQDRGGFAVRFMMVHDGRSYVSTQRVSVPFTDKRLNVEFTTFRSQLLPGEHERWTLTVKNHAGEAEMAEMVATLYDASLDEFATLHWPSPSFLFPQTYAAVPNNTPGDFTTHSSYKGYRMPQYAVRYPFPAISLYRFSHAYRGLFRNDGRGNTRAGGAILDALSVADPAYVIRKEPEPEPEPVQFDPTGTTVEEVVVTGFSSRGKVSYTGSVTTVTSNALNLLTNETSIDDEYILVEDVIEMTAQEMTEIATRQNFNETAFFYPQLRTNKQGEFVVEFTIPESLTRWNMLGFAHTKDLKAGMVRNSLITQKQVAVSANAPRFLREGDTIEFTAKVNNITTDALTGEALLQLFDAATMQPIEGVLTSAAALPFSVAARQSSGLRWTLAIPEGIQAITYRLTARAGAHTDGEERTIPVMTNTILVTETMPFMVRAGQTKEVDFTRLRENAATVKRNQGLTLEFTSNPAWYAVQAMPYLMEYAYECSEQLFSKFYANSLSAAIVGSTPRIKAIFEQWRDMPDSKNALLSNLEKNQELKQVLLEETPWVVQAENETERKKRVGLLFDLNQMAAGKRMAFDKLKKAQRGDGSFAWFEGLEPNRYITQHIIAGFSKLTALNAIGEDYAAEVQTIIDKGFEYLDADLLRDYERMKCDSNYYFSYVHLHYLYAASFAGHKPADAAQREAFDFYYDRILSFWTHLIKNRENLLDYHNLYGNALAALVLHRYGDTEAAQKVVASLRATSRTTEDMGMFWRENRAGYFWHEAPIETQALMISVFDEVAGDAEAVNELKIWLLRNKQTNDWQTTKATADACYALLRTGGDLLDENRLLEVKIGGRQLAEAADGEIRPEAGTGYVKTSWAGSDVTPGMGVLEVTNPNRAGIAWGGLYWQYFEQSDKITSTETDLRMEKRIFVKRNTTRGPELTEIREGEPVQIGDLLTVRLVLRAHRDYEYVHLKDMRAAGLEPVRTVSGYRYQDGLYYYENVKDASTNFFITSLRGGTYVFEYDLRVTHAGDFSNGITTFQCMYAPEFSAHSEGVRIKAVEMEK